MLYPPCENIGQGIEEKEKMILTVGRYNKIGEHDDFKKLEDMMRIFKSLCDTGLREYRFTLVVTYKEKDSKEIDRLSALCEGYPVDLLLNVSHENLVTLYQKAKIYWHAAGLGEDLINHPERAEHFGISTVEAMSAGAVPLVINAGGLPEIVKDRDNGLLWTDEEDLIQKTNELIHNEMMWKELSGKAIERAKLFTQEAFYRSVNRIVS